MYDDALKIYNSTWADNDNLLYSKVLNDTGAYNEDIGTHRTTDNWMFIQFNGQNHEAGFELTVRIKPLLRGEGTQESTYEIYYSDAWDLLCTNVAGGETYADKYFKQMADFTISQGVGSDDHAFSGHYDGNGKTLTANITSSGTAAPFGKVDGGTIKDLIVTGSVTTTMNRGADHSAGLIAKAAGTVSIDNVRVSATVTGYNYYGGFIGHGGNNSTISMTGCVFDGTLTENADGSTQHAGGLIGWGDNMTITISDCLFAGTSTIGTSGSGKRNFHPVGYHCIGNGASVTLGLTNVYYTVAPSAQTYENNGVALSNENVKQAYSITTSDANVTALAISGNPVEYNVSGLKRYATGIEYGTTLYAASGDAVSLTLGHADVIGQHFTGYEVSGGSSLDDATSDTPTLAMTTANQTISAGYSYNYSWTEDGKYATEFSTVSGSTITITSEAELARLAYLVNNGDNCSGKTYKLGQDLDMSENSWPTIGTSSTRFLGTFDGDGHTISGLHTPSSGLNYAALIHTSNGTVKNLTIANSSFYGTKYAAAIVCDNRNLVENCRVEGDVIVTCTDQEEGTYSGGVVAYQQNQDSGHGYSESTGVTRGCYSAAQVSGNDRVGGIMGRLASGTVEFSVSEATASSTVTTTRIAYVIGDQKAGSTAQYNYYISDTESSNTTDLRAYPVTLTDKLQQGGFAIVYGTNPNFDKSKLYFSRGQFSGTYYVGQFKVGDKWYAPKTINVSNSQTSDYYVKFYFTLTKEVDGYEVATVENVTVNDVAPSTENDNYRFEVNGAAIISGDPAITLYDNGELNEFYLTHNNGLTANVKLSGRTLIKDDNWNTLCLPFSIDDMNIANTPLAGAKLMSLANVNSETGFDSSTGTLTLDFVEAGEIEAGVAYIVKWETTGDPIENPVFEGVTITTDNPADRKTTSQDEKVSFVGTYTPLSYTNKETSVLFLGDGSTLYYPNGSNPTTIGAFRAYFQLNGITASESSSGVRAFNLNFGEGETTGILSTTNLTNYTNSGAWYDLSGRRLSSKPSAKGLYIHGGNKVVIK